MSKTMKGTLMTLIAGIAWGYPECSGPYLMVHGFSAIGLTNLRLFFWNCPYSSFLRCR